MPNTKSNAHLNPVFTIEDEKNKQILAAASHGDSSSTNNELKDILPIPCPNYIHKPIKRGKQRLRWNLMFNLLVWLIVPMPLWLPFVSQTVAIYLIPSVQAMCCDIFSCNAHNFVGPPHCIRRIRPTK